VRRALCSLRALLHYVDPPISLSTCAHTASSSRSVPSSLQLAGRASPSCSDPVVNAQSCDLFPSARGYRSSVCLVLRVRRPSRHPQSITPCFGRRSTKFLFDNRFHLRRTPIRHHAELLQHCPTPSLLFCRLASTLFPT
jgi:hypothetical protein